MRQLQKQIIEELGVQPSIDAAAEVARRVDFLADYVRATGTKGLVLGISGGQDSTLAGRLCQLAVEKLAQGGTVATFIAVRLPYAVQHDEKDAQLALDFIRPSRTITFNVHSAVDAVEDEYAEVAGAPLTDFHKGNVKARTRMIAQYAIAGEEGCLVVGTDHAAEAVTGFYTKYGDGGADLLPLSGLSKRQGRQLLEYLGCPVWLREKPPTADLLDRKPGQTDEADLGLEYEDIDDYLEGKELSDDVASAIEARFLVTRHKRTMPVTPADTWWRD
ncbi:ammonia-dependent NAD(+) synthetase [Mycetocola manganoxydans]|uniref:NH(3)-dependent NAD(+) synthetase n=1 Tax=Mycetocola manganoxydans TaxID=699879 RepID=A0A3L6ZVD3_9MICO|nr:ammonia-dependent NAD(+) synthetase [Mycetocola manganoxydans]RLP71645.1 ammonia-dependent NAD(+) synthetase [Mycetocola manganoxydans]GHD38837.1 NH(3)-dependent NAD(+) synthetase [Mycetocola manganoxydans]